MILLRLLGSGLVGDGSHTKAKLYSPVIDAIEKHALLQSPSRLEELVKIFIHATNVSFPPPLEPMNDVTDGLEMETGFWNMGEGSK